LRTSSAKPEIFYAHGPGLFYPRTDG
jgi:hypothetical protein